MGSDRRQAIPATLAWVLSTYAPKLSFFGERIARVLCGIVACRGLLFVLSAQAVGCLNTAAIARIVAIVLGFVVVSYGAIGAASDLPGSSGNASTKRAATMKIRIDAQGMVLTASLEDTDTSRDFVALLPLTLTLTDYASTEKISDLPRKLSIEGAPAGIRPVVGDVAYYAPWGNIAIFYKDFGYSNGLVRLGTLDSSPRALAALREPIKARVELIK